MAYYYRCLLTGIWWADAQNCRGVCGLRRGREVLHDRYDPRVTREAARAILLEQSFGGYSFEELAKIQVLQEHSVDEYLAEKLCVKTTGSCTGQCQAGFVTESGKCKLTKMECPGHAQEKASAAKEDICD